MNCNTPVLMFDEYTFVLFLLLIGTISCKPSLVLQDLDYIENPIDIPNSDRGFYRPQSFIVPVQMDTVPRLINLSTTIAGTDVAVNARIVYMEYDLRNFSSNSPITGIPVGPWGGMTPKYGQTQPLTPEALTYIRLTLQNIRESDAVAIIRSEERRV